MSTIMMIIGLIGGIGTGKSTVATMLSEFGAVHVDADKLGHQVYRKGMSCWHDVVAEFGREVLDREGEIDRKALGSIVFADPLKLETLGRIVQPCIRGRIEELIEEHVAGGTSTMVIEAAALTQAGWGDLVDEVWLVVSSEQVALRRLTKDRGYSEEHAAERIRLLASLNLNKQRADVVIENLGSEETLRKAVRQQWLAFVRRHEEAR
jgi:dephospho-CoA kinase